MLFRLIRPLRVVVRLFTAAGTPRQLAFGFALGMLIGLVPKGNLIAVGLTVILLASRANLGTGMIAAVLFSWVGMLADPLTHRTGEAFLRNPSLQPMWARLYDMPLGPWIGFNNTVVLGSLLLGLWLFYPVYRLGEMLFSRYQPSVVQWLAKYRIGQLLLGTEIAASWRVP
jgi:uncharacterized protein (TIGR03546 family)